MRRWAVPISILAVLAAVGVVLSVLDEDDNPAFDLKAEVTSADVTLNALFQSVGVRMQGGHRAKILDNGQVFDEIEAIIASSRRSVHLLLYIWEKGRASDRVIAALRSRDRAQVACKVLVDDFGSPDFDKNLRPSLEAVGCEVRKFRPVGEYEVLARNHRKIVIVDGRIAITGGFGIRDDWLGGGLSPDEWRDVAVSFQGPAVAFAEQAFAENWQEAGGELLPTELFIFDDTPIGTTSAAFVSSSASPVVTRAARFTHLMIAAASKRLWIANAYFVAPEPIQQRMMAKARAGIDVRLLVPGRHSDSKTAFASQNLDYSNLLASGVRVFEYQPTMLHSKTMLVDANLGSIGSVNLDPLSLESLEEVVLVFDDPTLNQQMAESFERDCSHAKELSR